MKAKNIRLCRRVVAFAMATSFTIVGTAAKVNGNEVKYSTDLVRGYYYDEDVKQNREDIMNRIKFGGSDKVKSLGKTNVNNFNVRKI
jgi:hypothetical protein